VPEKPAKVQSWCVFAGAARDSERRKKGVERRGTALLRRGMGSTDEGSMHQLLQQVMLLLTSKNESITDSAVCCANVAGKPCGWASASVNKSHGHNLRRVVWPQTRATTCMQQAIARVSMRERMPSVMCEL